MGKNKLNGLKRRDQLKIKRNKKKSFDLKVSKSQNFNKRSDSNSKNKKSLPLESKGHKKDENQSDDKDLGQLDESEGVKGDKKNPLSMNQDEVEPSDSKNSEYVFIGNVPLTIKSKSDLIKRLELNPKMIDSVHFRSLPIHPKYASNKKVGVIKKKFSDVKNNQNAYVKLTDPKYLEELLEKNTMEVDGHHIFINTNNKDVFSKYSRKKTLFVGRLPPSATEDDLFNIFMNISPVKAVRIVRDPLTMRSKGFGFVAFDNRLAVSEAIKELNNTQFKGYTLNVTKCLDENKSKEMHKKTYRNSRKRVKKTHDKRKI